jgi:hypothetical protein
MIVTNLQIMLCCIISDFCGSMMYVPDSQLIQDDDEDLDREHVGASHANQEGRDRHPSEPGACKDPPPQTAHVIISTTKVKSLHRFFTVIKSVKLTIYKYVIVSGLHTAVTFT